MEGVKRNKFQPNKRIKEKKKYIPRFISMNKKWINIIDEDDLHIRLDCDDPTTDSRLQLWILSPEKP